MPMTCPHCGSQLDDAPDLAGQWVACPRCNGQFQIPAPPVEIPGFGSASFAVPDPPFAIHDPPLVSPTMPRRAVPLKKQARHPAKTGMLLATICWPIAALGFGFMAYLENFSRYTPYGSNSVFIETGVIGAQAVSAEYVEAMGRLAMWTTVLFRVTPIYLAVMFVLFVFWFATNEGR